MVMDFYINGETLVKVKGMGRLSSNPGAISGELPKLWELGLALGDVVITPTFYHQDILIDDFGPNIPAEVLFNIAFVTITMTLVHYDSGVLMRCVDESMARSTLGVLVGAGVPMGNGGIPVTQNSPSNYISLNLLAPVGQDPWRFPTAYLAGPPFKLPLGTKRSAVELVWRAIPYSPLQTTTTTVLGPSGSTSVTTPDEQTSAGTILWSPILDEDEGD